MTGYKTFITAHSGADETPENSIEFVSYALGTEADALEIDVRRSEDGRLVLSHDEIADGGSAELAQVFEKLSRRRNMQVNCDLKEADLERQTFELAQDMGIADRLIFSGTVDPKNVKDLPMARENIYWNIDEQIPQLYERCKQEHSYVLRAMEDMCALCEENGITTINTYFGLVNDDVLEILYRHGIEASVWTVNEPDKIEYFLSRGVKNITTRSLREALFIRREKGDRAK